MIAWYYAHADYVTLDGSDRVSDWTNRGSQGSSMDLTQATTTRRPPWLATGAPNGTAAALDFDGTRAMKHAASITEVPLPWTIVCAVNVDTASSGRTLTSGWDTSHRADILTDNATNHRGLAGAGFVNGPSVTVTGSHSIEFFAKASEAEVYTDATAGTTGSAGHGFIGITVGSYLSEATGFFDGKVMEVMVINRAITAGERSELYSYMQSEWGI